MVKLPASEADHSPASRTEVKNVWSCALTPPYTFYKEVQDYDVVLPRVPNNQLINKFQDYFVLNRM
jgi:hypothetical protein